MTFSALSILFVPRVEPIKQKQLKSALKDVRTDTKGSIMCKQLKSLDYISRGIQFKDKLPSDLLEEIQDVLQAIIE